MKNKTIKLMSSIMAVTVLTGTLTAGAVNIESFSDDLRVYLNGTDVYSQSANKPFIMNERTLVPLRPIFEAMGLDGNNINWYPEEQKATFSDGVTECTFVNESATVARQGNGVDKSVELDVPATIYNGNFYIPLRAFCNLWDIGIEWDDASRSVYVTGGITPASAVEEHDELSFGNFIGEWSGISGMHLAQHMDIIVNIISVDESNNTITLTYKYDMGPSGVWSGNSVDYSTPITVSYHEETVNVEAGKTSYGTTETTETLGLVTDMVQVIEDSAFKLAIVDNNGLYYSNAPHGFSYYESNKCTKIN